jgi:hypothetical protein
LQQENFSHPTKKKATMFLRVLFAWLNTPNKIQWLLFPATKGITSTMNASKTGLRGTTHALFAKSQSQRQTSKSKREKCKEMLQEIDIK